MGGRGGRSGAHLAQLLGVLVELFQDGQCLLLGAVLQDPLDDSAAIRVRGQHKHLPRGSKVTFPSLLSLRGLTERRHLFPAGVITRAIHKKKNSAVKA